MMTTVTRQPFTDTALRGVIRTLQEAGLSSDTGAEDAFQNPDRYFSGSLEWSERGFGTRFYLDADATGRVYRVRVANLYSEMQVISTEDLKRINDELAETLEFENG